MRSNLLLSIFATVIALALFEFGLRMAGTFLTHSERNTEGELYFSTRRNEVLDSWFWVHRPNDTLSFEKPEFTFNRVTNSLGLSDVEWEREDTSYVILGIGDSFTEGTGVSEDSTWLKLVEQNLNRKLNYPVISMNGGVGGSDPVFEYLLLERKLLDYHPDLVILSVNSSDVIEVALRGGFERFKEDGTTGRPAPEWEHYYEKYHTVRFFVHVILRYNKDLIKNSEAEENQRRFMPIMNSVISKIDSLSNQNGFDYLIAVHPISHDFKGDEYNSMEINQLLEMLRKTGVPHIDIRQNLVKDGYKTEEDVKPIYWPIDMHFNGKGYSLYASYIAQKIEYDYLNSDLLFTK